MRERRLLPFRLPLLAFTIMLGLQVVSAAVLFVRKMGLDPSSVQAFYLGSEATFTRPRTFEGLLEVAVPHLFAVPMVLFITGHLIEFASVVRRNVIATLATSAFVVALLGISLGFGVRFVSPHLAWLKIGSFLAMEGMLVLWLVLLIALFRKPRADVREPSAVARPAGG